MQSETHRLNPWGSSAEWSDGIPPEIHPCDAEVLSLLLGAVKRPHMKVLEVGSWVGNGSTRVIVENIRDAGGTLYCADTWRGSDNVEHHQEYRRQHGTLFGAFHVNVDRYHGLDVVRPLVMSSIEAARIFADRSLDLVFIDGNHGYSHVKQDIRAWLPKVKVGGILCGHDCDARFTDLVPELRREAERCGEQDVLENHGFPGPPAFHAGVVRAVDEMFLGQATLWHERKPSTVWSYRKTSTPRTLLRRARASMARSGRRILRKVKHDLRHFLLARQGQSGLERSALAGIGVGPGNSPGTEGARVPDQVR